MVDTDNVLLLRAPSAQAALNVPRRDPIAEAPSKWSVAAVIAPVAEAERALELFEREIASAVVTAGDTLLGYFVSETSPNNFPRLPVREDVQVLVFLVGYSDEASLDVAKGVLGDVARVLTEEGEPPEVLRLAPTPRSLLGGNSAQCVRHSDSPFDERAAVTSSSTSVGQAPLALCRPARRRRAGLGVTARSERAVPAGGAGRVRAAGGRWRF
jgi:hypothetical protein